MTSGIEIRAARIEDAAPLALLRYRFRTETGSAVESEVDFLLRATPWIAERLARIDWRAWVAVDATDVIRGHVFVHFIEKMPNPGPGSETLAYLTNLYVDPALRNRGIGATLIKAVADGCEGRDAETIFLRPTRDSVPLYRRHGFADARLLERRWSKATAGAKPVTL
jgi:GNAT superfamily N-acetyltransferase